MKHKGSGANKKRYFEENIDENQEDMVGEVSVKWYETKLKNDPKHFTSVKEDVLISLKEEAKKCYEAEVANYNTKKSRNNSNYSWMKTVMTKGTVADKVAAYIITIQDNPLCCLEQIRHLISMVKVSKKKECIAVIENLTELFLTDLLKPNEKLKAFYERPLSLLKELSSGNDVTRKKYLTYWYFESELKEAYASYILALNVMSHDTVETNKEKTITAMYKLLCGNPEQEKNLLTYLVNKLGDPVQKVASKVIYCLTQLLFRHPNRQGVVLMEIEKLLFRPNISTKAQYYALCFLSQYYLNHENANIAKKLIELYFAFFKACIKKGEVNSRMMSALLMGVSRAYPYAKMDMNSISDHIDTIYRVVHVANFNVALHALQLLYQVSDDSSNLNDRFYSALYKKLADDKLTTSTHSAILLNLIYKSLLRDKEPARVKTFIKRLLQLALASHPSFACGILFLISHVLSKKSDCIALKKEKNNTVFGADDGDDEEKYLDVKEDIPVNESGKEVVNEETKVEEDVKVANGIGWYHCKVKETKPFKSEFNPLARNPLYAGGEHASYIELFDLTNHFHPTVSLFATQILNGELIKYSGDPLKDFALIRFLDRFVFKNPKKTDNINKQGPHPTFGQRKNYAPVGPKAFSVTSSNYLDQEKKIPVDELFLINYMKTKRKNFENKKDDEDLESVCSEDFEEMLNKMGRKDLEDVDDDLDYMNEIGDNLKTKKQKQKRRVEDAEEEEEDEDLDELVDNDEDDESIISDENDVDDLEMNDEDKELIGNTDDDDSDIVFDEDDETVDERSKKKKNNKFENIFASADEFASILEEEGNSAYAPGSSNAMMNKDKAAMKQLDWEEKRNRWIKGFNNAMHKSNKFSNQKRKRQHNKSGSNKNENKKHKVK